MSGIILRWGVPALLTVVGGTTAAVITTGASMTADLTTRGSSALLPDHSWAEVTFDGRNAIISGTATDQASIDAAIARVAEVHGVRAVASNVVLAEFVSPFPFEAIVENGQLALRGGVPDERAHADILLRSGAPTDGLRLMSGAPQRGAWDTAVSYVLEAAAQLDDGEVKLADLDVSISGRAKSAQAFDLLQEMTEQLPDGVTLKSAAIEPALASPFVWSAVFDGSRVEISGFKPDETFVERLRIADLAGRPVSTTMLLASGAPAGFEDNAVLLLQNLLQLERGEATISDSVMTLKGAPPDAATAEKVRSAMTPSGTNLLLEPHRVREYLFESVMSNGGITLKGVVPDQATKDRLENLDGVDASALELARGAPERFESGVEFAIDALRRMSEGSVTIDGTSIVMQGRAATLADFSALTTTLNLGAPQGLILRQTEILPPIASPFTWTAEKASGGTINLSGYVPSQETSNAQHQAAPIGADTTTIADGEPENFERLTVSALDVLELLDSGKVSYDGAIWSITGAVDSAQKGFAAESAFNQAGLRDAGWSYAITLPKPVEVAALPIIDPYTWRAQKAADGTVTFSGFLPTEVLKRFLANRVGDKLRDTSSLGAGAPASFVTDALAGLDALLALEEGSLAFAGGAWTLAGKTANGTQRIAVQDTLIAAVDESTWQIAIQAMDAAPVVSPFLWSAVKGENGRVSLSGYLTTDELRRFVAVRAGDVVSDTTELGSGEPAGFMADVLAGLEALGHLSSGSVTFDGETFSLVGVPATIGDRDAALAALSSASNGGAGWTKDLAEPVAVPVPEPEPVVEPIPEPTPEPEPVVEPTPEPQPEPVVEPTPEPAPEPAGAPIPVARTFSFEASKARGGQIDLVGTVPADATRRFFGVIAGGVPTERMTISGDLPDNFITSADIGIRTLGVLADGKLGFDGTNWVLDGRVATEEERTAALASLATVPSTQGWETNVTLLPPIEICKEKVTAFASRNAILFQSGSATITSESGPALDELTGYLTACPEATVHIEGHTDSDGDEALNLALSVSRAEAVVDALISRGVGFQRLYAVGYGESTPIASNDTPAGKQANRRIAFTILDEHQ
jgi:outer membrane protein OmpA-like peptidoglycan-associated protein/osmotically-inducible protein OsmY